MKHIHDSSSTQLYNEEKILFSGISVAVILALSVLIITFFSPATSGKVLSIVTTHLLTGRAGGIATGIELSVPLPILAVLSTTIDSIVVLIVYPLFVMISKKRIENHLLNKVLHDTEDSARKHQKEIRRYGLIGLLFFVWFPLHMTGPLAGSILGYFLGFSHTKTLITVISGTAMAVVSWLFIFREISDILGRYSVLLPISIIVIALVGFILYRYRKKRKENSLK